jgi:hypothetical protein
MMQYHTIANDDDEIKISVGVDEKGKYYMPYIIFEEIKDIQFPDLSLVWDNEDFIFGEFKAFLHRWKHRTLLPEDTTEFEEIWDILDEETVEELIEMLELALKQKWYIPKHTENTEGRV